MKSILASVLILAFFALTIESCSSGDSSLDDGHRGGRAEDQDQEDSGKVIRVLGGVGTRCYIITWCPM